MEPANPSILPPVEYVAYKTQPVVVEDCMLMLPNPAAGEPHPFTNIPITFGIFINVKLNVTVAMPLELAEILPQSICLAVEPPTTIAVAFSLPLTSNELLDVSDGVMHFNRN